MPSIDRADWHYDGEFPEGLPRENGGTHIGMYLNWIIDNDLIGELHLEESIIEIEDVKARKINGRDFLFDYCDEKFCEDDLNEEGLNFTKYYYQDSKNPEEGFGQYFEDFEDALTKQYDTIYEVPNTWENYDQVAKRINKAYLKWKKKDNKSSWKFWKKREV